MLLERIQSQNRGDMAIDPHIIDKELILLIRKVTFLKMMRE